MEPNCHGCHSHGTEQAQHAAQNGAKQREIIVSLFPTRNEKEQVTNQRIRRGLVISSMQCMGRGLPTTDVSDTKLTYDGLFLALQELLEMLHTLSGNLKFVCQQFLYPTRLRDSVTKCLLRCFRDYEFKFCLSVSFFQASFTPFFVSRLRRRLSVHSFTHRIHF